MQIEQTFFRDWEPLINRNEARYLGNPVPDGNAVNLQMNRAAATESTTNTHNHDKDGFEGNTTCGTKDATFQKMAAAKLFGTTNFSTIVKSVALLI